ncbi:MAG: alginate lyase family protein [Planctomycetes bacterium]|nr:alginate lyase family protein [Planctomycetota bacterium]
MDGKYGLKQQIQKGIQPDGFWFEGSISYHFYTISSLQPLYLAAKGQGYSLEGTQKFRLMYTAPIDFTFDNSEFPANNDGWPGKKLNAMESYYEIAAGLWGDYHVVKLLNSVYTRQSRSSQNALLYGPATLPKGGTSPPRSVLFEDSGIAMLRNDSVNAYLKFGPYGGGHDHNDRLNLILFANGNVIIPDLGTSGYGIALNGRWFRSSAAHNMLVVDGKRQANCGGYLVSYAADKVCAGVKDAYKGVDIRRRVVLPGNGIEDIVTAESESIHQYDLFYHVRGKFQSCNMPLTHAGPFQQSNGYNMLKDLRKGTCSKQLEISWVLRDAPGILKIQCNCIEPFDFYIGTCPDNPADKEMSVLMLRRKDKVVKWSNMIGVLPAR